MSSSLKRCNSIADLRKLARKRLPRAMFDYLDGGAEDEITMQRNISAFRHWQFVPRVLVDVTSVNLASSVQGENVDIPLLFSPTGGTRLFHHLGEKAVVPVAEKEGTIFSLSTMATTDIETAAACGTCPKWFQIYVWKDRGMVREFIQRCRGSGYKALCLTVDTGTSGKRERDMRSGMTMPPKLTLASLLDMAVHPAWWWNTLTNPTISLANMAGKAGPGRDNATALGKYAAEQLDPAVNWDDVAWMVEEWGGPFLLKGLSSPEDARRAADLGCSGVIVSNHGGRQLDHSAASITMLPEVVDAVEGRLEVLLDGGVRRGSDIVKALALGATACMIGRPFLYGLAAGGQAGVEHAFETLRDEMVRSMKLLGCTDVNKLNRDYLKYLP